MKTAISRLIVCCLSLASIPTASRADAEDHRVTLAPEARARAGLVLITTEAAHSDGAREAAGRVLDALPLAEQVASREAARAVLVQVRSERERVVALHRADQNTSTREVEAAELSLRRAELELAVAQQRLEASWGDSLARREDLPALARRLVERSAALGRVEVPSGDPAAGTPVLAQVSLVTTRTPLAGASLLAPAPTTDPLTQGRGQLLLLEQKPPPPGTAIVALLRFASEARTGVRVPRSAVVWQDGETFVWVESGGDTFERRAITLFPARDGDYLGEGIEPGARLVVSGAQELLSEELLVGREPE